MAFPSERDGDRARAEQMTALFGSRGVGVGSGVDDRIVEANDELLRILGHPRSALAEGLLWPDLTPQAHLERDAAALEQVRREGSATVVKEFVRPDGTGVPVLAVVAATGWNPYQWVAVVIDLSADERLKHLAWSEAAIVSTLLEDAPVGFAFISPDLRFVRVNREIAAMNGYSVEDHQDADVFTLLPGIRETAEPLLRRVLAGGEPLRDAEVVGTTPADPDVTHTWLESFFPIRTPHGPVLGVAAIARDITRLRALQGELAATSAKLARAMEEVQKSLQPASTPVLDGYSVAVRYLPAEADVGLGGDWCDITLAPDGRLVVSVGDVVGHGIEAIGAMGRASSALRAFVHEGHGPGRSLGHLDTLLAATTTALATAAIVSVDTRTGATRYALAAHPHPVLLGSDGRVRTLSESAGGMLGLTTGRYAEARADLDPGSTLVLYTDGLIERRGDAAGEAAARLRAALEREAARDPEDFADGVLRRCLPPGPRRDDVCLVAVRRHADPPIAQNGKAAGSAALTAGLSAGSATTAR